MHSTDTSAMTFFHNGDFDGPVYFKAVEPATGAEREVAAPFPVLAAAALRHDGQPDHAEASLEVRAEGESTSYGETVTVAVPVGALRDLIGKRVERERVRRLEEMSYAELYQDGVGHEVAAWASEEVDWT